MLRYTFVILELILSHVLSILLCLQETIMVNNGNNVYCYGLLYAGIVTAKSKTTCFYVITY